MTRIQAGTIAAVSAAVFAIGVLALHDLTSSQQVVDQKEATIIYACGYIAGQVAIMSRLPTLFQSAGWPQERESCAKHRAAAARNGFTAVTP